MRLTNMVIPVEVTRENAMFEPHTPFPIPTSPGAAVASPATDPNRCAPLQRLLVGEGGAIAELPALPDMIGGAIALASGARRKVMLPLSQSPAEFALVRHGRHVSIDCYTTESAPEIIVRRRTVPLRDLLEACAASGSAAAALEGPTTAGRVLTRLVSRVEETAIHPDTGADVSAVECTGGSLAHPGDAIALAFGFRARVTPPLDQPREAHAFADVHALLFEGELWAFHAGRREPLTRGPILMTAQRMVRAVRALIDAWQADRDMHVRLRSGSLGIGVRKQGSDVTLTLTTASGRQLTWQTLDVPSCALPILRLTSDLLRRLVAVDRHQSHNLRVTALRTEVRQLRRVVRSRNAVESFENVDPERLRLSSQAPAAPSLDAATAPHPGRLRYSERWSAEIDGLDASSVFLCGQRMIVATQKLTFAVDRNDGDVLWSTPSARATSMIAGRHLLRLHEDGELELCDVATGDVDARARLAAHPGGHPSAQFVGGGDLPPMAIICEGHRSLVAVDLRTGQPRWRFKCRGEAGIRMASSGRVLVVVSGDSAIDALDISSGEVVWRFSDRVRFCLAPAIVDDVVVAPSGEPGGGAGAIYGIELYTGRLRYQEKLPAAPSARPIAAGGLAVLPFGGSRQARLAAIDPQDGRERWVCHDPGLDNGGCALEVDGTLMVNTPRGRLTAIGLDNGEARWSSALSNPLTDDVPRQLMPQLRQGALFVPSAQVHVVRPSDGGSLTSSMACDLVPDFMCVDERGWLYVAEESGHLRAYASAPHLSLVGT